MKYICTFVRIYTRGQKRVVGKVGEGRREGGDVGLLGLCGVVWSYVGLVFCNVYEVFLYTFFCALF